MWSPSSPKAGGPEFLKTKSRAIIAQTSNEQSVHTYYYLCSRSPSEAGGPEFPAVALRRVSRSLQTQTHRTIAQVLGAISAALFGGKF